MTPSPGLFALTRRRFATPRSAAIVIVVLTAFAAFVIAAAPRALVGVVRAEVSHQISGMAASSRDLTGDFLGLPMLGDAGAGDDIVGEWDAGGALAFGDLGAGLAAVRDDFDPALRELTGTAEFAVYGEPFLVVPEEQPADDPFSVVQLLSEPDATAHVEVVEGQWPRDWSVDEDVLEIALSADAAQTMGWPVGQERGVPAPGSSPTDGVWDEDFPVLRLAAVVEAIDPDDDRWTHLPTALTATVFDDGNSRPRATAAAWVSPLSRLALDMIDSPRMVVWYPVDGAGAQREDPAELLAALRAATSSSVAVEASGETRVRFASEVQDVLATALSRANSASSILAVAAVGPLAVSVALVVLAATLVIRRRRTDLALMSARGAPLARLRGLLLAEGLILGVPAAALATAAGVALTPNDAGPLPTLLAVLVGVVPAVALAMTLRPALLERGRSDLDSPVRSRAARILGVIVVIVAAAAVAQLLVRGIGRGTESIDPLVVVAPLLATVAVALVVVRLHPLPIAAALRVSRRGRGVVGLVGAARNLRDSAAGTTAVLAMLVAVAVAVFSSVVLATVDRGAVVAAQRDVGADIRLSGPYFDPDTIERMRGTDGVSDAVGILAGDYLGVQGPDGSASVQIMVTEADRLADIQRGMVGAFPVGAITPESDPIEVVMSTELGADVGTEGVTLAGTPVEVTATLDRLLGISTSTSIIVMDEVDYTALTTRGFFPRSVYVDIDADADPQVVAASLDEVVGAPHSTALLEESTAEIQASPAVTALRFVLFAALVIAVGLSVVALLLVAGVSQESRSRAVALLRTLGLDRRRARGIVAWEFVPLGITALVGGVLLGVVLPLLVVGSIDLRPFTGGGGQPSLAVDPLLSGILIAAVVVALALAVVGGVLSARTTSMAAVLRTEED
ncbi:putative ABC transport system permease protein [Microbacterium terrae]|uniref:FtsX-like permease family protein n=1 Tax=Microbacterium terrae TaxID=69369 RepID=A0A0M2H5L3_9MICO|nr:FtsX-like permease family protein [Microbacterium terrae]KJL39259.1 FtsX-like permease family protein [Microbacterium terrae]MBP1076807.1 putative ABC transport system permease protein [Microbacterium terrae]GLJ99401.1 hypothetical protein GCM10017594_25990 [Microbacterium terrae]